MTRSADKRALAETLGADLTIPGGDDARRRKVREATEGRGADVDDRDDGCRVAARRLGINMTRSGGRVLMFGIITAKEGALPFYDLYFKESSLINARVAKSEDYPGAIAPRASAAWCKLEPLVSDVHAARRAEGGHRHARVGRRRPAHEDHSRPRNH